MYILRNMATNLVLGVDDTDRRFFPVVQVELDPSMYFHTSYKWSLIPDLKAEQVSGTGDCYCLLNVAKNNFIRSEGSGVPSLIIIAIITIFSISILLILLLLLCLLLVLLYLLY